MSRIASKFAALHAAGRKALIPFVTAGDPSLEATVPVMHALVAAGADVIELGVPFSDPMADGPTIQRSSERALGRGAGLRWVLQQVAAPLARAMQQFMNRGFATWQERFAVRDALAGQTVWLSDGSMGQAVGVNPQGAFLIESQGRLREIRSEEISVRPIEALASTSIPPQ